MDSPLICFYKLECADSEGRMLSDIWDWPDEEWEMVHDFIQWLFPLDQPSNFNSDAPLLTEIDQMEFLADSSLRNAMRRSLIRFCRFLGLQFDQSQGKTAVTRALNFGDRSAVWAHRNHNWLRVSRVLRSLRLTGMDDEAAALFGGLERLHRNDGLVTEESFTYWRKAATARL